MEVIHLHNHFVVWLYNLLTQWNNTDQLVILRIWSMVVNAIVLGVETLVEWKSKK